MELSQRRHWIWNETRISGGSVIRNFTSTLLVLAAFGGGVLSCGGQKDDGWRDTPPPLASAENMAPAVTPVVPLRTDEYSVRSLSDLALEAVDYLAAREGSIGVAVVVPSEGTVYSWNGDSQFHMASVAKVAIMLTVMNQAIEEGRPLTPEESSYLRPMITISDNPTASLLWARIGGGDGVERYLRSIGLDGINPNKDSCWGASYASAEDAALLFAKLALGEILDSQMRQIALDLLREVDPSQTWGVIAAAPGSRPEGSIVTVKDGWYPADCGWWVNSAGMLLPSNDKPAYTMAVLTAEQSTWQYGIETIETVGEMVHKRLHGD